MLEHIVTDELMEQLAENLNEAATQYFEMYQLKHPGEHYSVVFVHDYKAEHFIVISMGEKIPELKEAMQRVMLGY